MDGKVSNFNQVASLRRYTLTNGTGAGLEVLDCDNGNIRFLLNASKALDVMQVYHQGKNLSFISKNGFTKREIPFLNRFEGGMVYTCGLDSVGGREGYELHGSFHNIPAEIVRAECNEQGIVVEAVMRETALFGANLVMRRKITAEIGGDSLQIEDTLSNEGYKEENYCLLYHINLGYPMLDDGAKIIATVDECEPRNEWAKTNQSTMYQIQSPEPNQEETCYFLKLQKPQVCVVNERLGKTFTLSYSQDTLPCFVEWKSMVSGDYALGLEPCTTKLDGHFNYKIIQPQQKIQFRIVMQVKNL
ncbi:MAG: DUF4432 family protein [Clostridiales bacterium]|nr:DUF4432 family protein [Clostridiales bacterium]